jgi:hypothetical protein
VHASVHEETARKTEKTADGEPLDKKSWQSCCRALEHIRSDVNPDHVAPRSSAM